MGFQVFLEENMIGVDFKCLGYLSFTENSKIEWVYCIKDPQLFLYIHKTSTPSGYKSNEFGHHSIHSLEQLIFTVSRMPTDDCYRGESGRDNDRCDSSDRL